MQVILIKIFFLLLLFGIVLFFLCLHKGRTKENARCHKRSAYAAMPAHKARDIIIWKVISIVGSSCYDKLLQALAGSL
jgi:nucleoside recognition membrane protein YjiH